jgi:glycosyltransferase involved in cell wall biosynthesis
MSKRKVFHVITTIERGGAENAVATLAKAQARNGHEVKVIPLKGKLELKESLTRSGVEVPLFALGKSVASQIRVLRRTVDKEAIIHAHLPRAEMLCRIAFGKGQSILTRHNSEQFFPSAPKYLSRILSNWVTKESKLIVISEAVLQFLETNFEIHKSCIPKVIYYGYEKASGPESNQKNRVRNGGKIRIGTVSRLATQKNLPLLIELTSRLREVGYDIETTIVGGGPLESKLKRLTQEKSLEDTVKFLGRKSEVLDYLKSLDVFILTSKYEGFGLVLLEAMDAGTPVVAPNNSAIPEVLGYEHPGLFDSNSITSLLNISSLMIDNAQVQSEKFKNSD